MTTCVVLNWDLLRGFREASVGAVGQTPELGVETSAEETL